MSLIIQNSHNVASICNSSVISIHNPELVAGNDVTNLADRVARGFQGPFDLERM